MKRVIRLMVGMILCVGGFAAFPQSKMDEQRMDQDIEVAENILSTLIRQQFGKRNFFPMEVRGSYLSGYGVTFRLPNGGPFNAMLFEFDSEPNIVISNPPDGSYSYSYSYNKKERTSQSKSQGRQDDCEDCEKEKARIARAPQAPMKVNDSLSATADKRFVEIAKSFLADYGDVISQLKPDERITITNRSEDFDGDYNFKWAMNGRGKSNLISVEAKRDDITQMKQGKLTRDQFIGRLKILSNESSEALDPDLEVLASMFSRLYRNDLSKTYYSTGNIHYERMKDFGVIYYMKVYSSEEQGNDRFMIPTMDLDHLTRAERDQKVTELYPRFESELKENLAEYGRTLRSLKDDEQLVINVKLTQCKGCGIPVSIEASVKNSVLKDYSSGKTSKDATVAKVIVKKMGSQ